MSISPIPELVTELAAGRMVILVDEEDRENEGGLVLAAEVTRDAVRRLALEPGRPVHALVKAVSIDVSAMASAPPPR